jgi:hypothetical protein
VQALNDQMVWMVLFILSYSITSINTSKKPYYVYLNDIIYSFSGLLFTVFLFQLSVLEEQKEYQWVVGFLLALTFKEILNPLMEFVVDVVNGKLAQVKEKIVGK